MQHLPDFEHLEIKKFTKFLVNWSFQIMKLRSIAYIFVPGFHKLNLKILCNMKSHFVTEVDMLL